MRFLKVSALIISYILAKILIIKRRPVILMYHSFDDEGWRYGVSPRMIERQIRYLLKHSTLVSTEEIVKYAQGKIQLPNNSVSITVDDGYDDTYKVLFPLAKKYKIPFTVFLTTDLDQQETLGNLSRLNWNQLQEMHDSGLMSIGLHGHTHQNFVEVLKLNLVNEEIIASEKIIKEKLGVMPEIVAYPYGIYDNDVISLIKNRGYKAAVSISSGFVNKGDDLYKLRRVEVSRHISFRMFTLRLTPALLVYKKIFLQIKRMLITLKK